MTTDVLFINNIQKIIKLQQNLIKLELNHS